LYGFFRIIFRTVQNIRVSNKIIRSDYVVHKKNCNFTLLKNRERSGRDLLFRRGHDYPGGFLLAIKKKIRYN
jgi:hypothetical protein